MNSFRILLALSAATLLVPVATAQAQSQPAAQNNTLGNILGAIFGNQQMAEQTMEADWNQGRQPFSQRRDMVESRIAEGVNNGSISRSQADSIRRDYYDLVDTEARYAANGSINQEQQRDLRNRYQAMMQRLGDGSYTGNGQSGYGSTQSIAQQQGDFNARVNQAVQQRQLTPANGRRLRTDFQGLMQLESSYASNGIDGRERADLANRLADLESRLGSNGFGFDGNPARWQQLEQRIQQAERNRSMTSRDAGQLRTEVSDLTRLDAAYLVGGYNADQRAYLTRRYAEVEARVGPMRR